MVILSTLAVLYFAGAGSLVAQTGNESQHSSAASIVSYERDDYGKYEVKSKTVDELVSEKVQLQQEANTFTAQNKIEEAKEVYTKIIAVDDEITRKLNTLKE